MRFIVSSAQLLKNLQKISGVISTNTVLPILEDFLFQINKGRLHITATDLDTTMSVEMDIEANDDFTVAIPARILLDSLKALPDQPITIAVNESLGIEITTDNGKYKLSGENPEDFPKEPIATGTESFKIEAAVLNNSVQKSLFAVSNDELRPAMTGVFFQLDENGITFVATDAHKLVKINRKDIEVSGNSAFIVPKKALGLLKGVLPNSNTEVTVEYGEQNAFISFDNIKLICRLIDAKYPDYNAVIPKENPNLLTINKADLLASLRRTSIFSNKTTHQVALGLNASELEVSAKDLDFSNEASEKLNCEYKGNPMEIGFNAKFLIEMLSVLENEAINIELSTPNRAGIIKPTDLDENEDLLMLVMPVMLNN
ncbi:MAG: DNA polymerase III subunit beta [Chitinophagales bacterium]|nr:DNA polymerase III subunit beta [Chitinophagales bacterium]